MDSCQLYREGVPTLLPLFYAVWEHAHPENSENEMPSNAISSILEIKLSTCKKM